MQFDQEKKGFSFQKDGPLDMRMNPLQHINAKDVINKMSEKELGYLFREYGEEKLWRKGAKAICQARRKKEIQTTKELADIVQEALPSRRKLHPATKIFQAIRIFVNQELESIEGSLKKAVKFLANKGKVGVISFHSLEDRIVKNVFKDAAKPTYNTYGKKIGESAFQILTKKPLVPSFRESKKNRRARSARMRFIART